MAEGAALLRGLAKPFESELFAALRGSIDVILFDEGGAVVRRHRLDAGTGNLVEIPGGTWHSFVFAAPGSVALEPGVTRSFTMTVVPQPA